MRSQVIDCLLLKKYKENRVQIVVHCIAQYEAEYLEFSILPCDCTCVMHNPFHVRLAPRSSKDVFDCLGSLNTSLFDLLFVLNETFQFS